MIEVSKLSEDQWKDYLDLQLEALKKEHLAFSSSYEESKEKPWAEWRDQINNVLFVLYQDKPWLPVFGLPYIFTISGYRPI